MPDSAGSKTQRAADKYAYRASRPAHTPARLQPGLHRKTTFCFSALTCRPTLCRPVSLYDSTSSDRQGFRFRLGRPIHLVSSHLFFQASPAFRLRLHPLTAPSALATSFRPPFSFFLFFSPKRKGKPTFAGFPLFLTAPIQAFLLQFLSLPSAPSSPCILPRWPRSGYT